MNAYDPTTGRWITEADRYEALRLGKPEYRSLDDAIRTDPERAWPVLLALIADVPEELLDLAGAGPLEDFLVRHAVAFADRIESRARSDAHFRECLACTWLSDGAIPDAIQQRLLDMTDHRILILPPNEAEP